MGLMDFFKRKSSGDVAKDRLKLLLVSDRANCSPDVMEMIKNDIIQVISKYMEIDAEGLDIQITQTESEGSNGTVPALFANIPIRDMKYRPSKQGKSIISYTYRFSDREFPVSFFGFSSVMIPVHCYILVILNKAGWSEIAGCSGYGFMVR